LEDQGVDGRMRSVWILGRLARGCKWIQLAQNRGRWRAAVNTVMKPEGSGTTELIIRISVVRLRITLKRYNLDIWYQNQPDVI
jgi:hypothetical protein